MPGVFSGIRNSVRPATLWPSLEVRQSRKYQFETWARLVQIFCPLIT